MNRESAAPHTYPNKDLRASSQGRHLCSTFTLHTGDLLTTETSARDIPSRRDPHDPGPCSYPGPSAGAGEACGPGPSLARTRTKAARHQRARSIGNQDAPRADPCRQTPLAGPPSHDHHQRREPTCSKLTTQVETSVSAPCHVHPTKLNKPLVSIHRTTFQTNEPLFMSHVDRSHPHNGYRPFSPI